MIKNKKIIAFICAFAMIFSVFGAFTVASATPTEGIVLEYDKDASTTTKIVINAKYVGVDAINGYGIKIQLPENYTNVTYTSGLAEIATPTTYIDPETKVYGIVGTSANPTSSADKKIVTITIELSEPMTSAYKMQLLDDSVLTKTDGKEIGIGSNYGADEQMNGVDAITIPKDPDEDIEIPLPKPPVTDPENNPLPEAKDPVNVTEGITIEYDKDASDDTTIVLVAKYVGVDAINGYGIKIQLPQNYTDVTYTSGLAEIATPTTYIDPETKVYGIVGTSANPASSADKVIVTITIKLSEALDKDYIFELLDDSVLTKTDGKELGVGKNYGADEKLPVAWTKAPAAGAEVLDNEMPLITQDGKQGLVDVSDNLTLSENAYAALEVKKADGSDAKYGDDYVAYYKGEKLTKEQLDNLLAGAYVDTEDDDLTNDSLLDMLKDVTIQYNNGITGKLQIVDNDEVVASGETETSGPDKDNSQSGSITPAKTDKSADAGESITVKLNVKPAKDKNGDVIPHDGKKDSVSVNVDAASFNVLSATGITVETTAADGTVQKERLTINDADNDTTLKYVASDKSYTYTFKFTPLAKTPKDEPIAFTVTYTDAYGKSSKATVKYTVKEKNTGSSSSSSSGSGSNNNNSGTGIIANGDMGGYTDGTGYNTTPFVDMAGYDWAQEAVSALAAKNLISGKGNGIFDPGGQITRAEYAQMVVNAIGRSGDYADTSFLDVPTDAWFYHNIAVAYQLGIVSGYGNGYFGPYDLITREQMALMTQKAAIAVNRSLAGAAVQAFTDDAEISDWAKAAVYDLANVGVINGTGNGAFTPKANATRAEAAVIIYNAFVK